MAKSKRRQVIEPYESKLVQDSFDARGIHKVIKTRTQRNVSFIIKIVSVYAFIYAILRIKYINVKLGRLLGSSMIFALIYYSFFLLYGCYILFAIYATYKIHTTLGDDIKDYKKKEKQSGKSFSGQSRARELTKKLENLTYSTLKKKPSSKPSKTKSAALKKPQLEMLGLTREEYDIYENTQERQRFREEAQRHHVAKQEQKRLDAKFAKETKELQRATPPPQQNRTPTPTGITNPFADLSNQQHLPVQSQPPLFIHSTTELERYLDSCKKTTQDNDALPNHDAMKQPNEKPQQGGYLNKQNYFVSGTSTKQDRFAHSRDSVYQKVEKQSSHLKSFLKGTDAAYQKYMQTTIGDMDAQMLSYASTVISDDIPTMNQVDDSSVDEPIKTANTKYDYNARFSGAIQPMMTDTSPRPTTQKKKLDIQSRYAAVLKSLNITSFQMSMWSDRLRRWLGEKLLKPLVQQIDMLNEEMRLKNLTPFDCTHELDQPPSKYLPIPPQMNPNQVGEITLRKIIHFSFPRQDPMVVNRLALEKYLYMPHTDRRYVIKRIKALITGGYLANYKWNGGGDFEGKQWEDYSSIYLPTDAELLLTIFCNYMDFVLPSDGIFGKRAFTRIHFQDRSTKAHRHRLALRRKEDQRLHDLAIKQNQTNIQNPAENNLGLVMESRTNPYFSIEFQFQLLKVEPGRLNLFKTLVLFVYLIKKKFRSYLHNVWLENQQLAVSSLLRIISEDD